MTERGQLAEKDVDDSARFLVVLTYFPSQHSIYLSQF
jgi:hypothetical protein